MKKNMGFIFAIALTLNLLPQTSDAWTLEKKGDDTILIWNNDIEKENWGKYDLPHAIHSKLVGRNVTVLDIAKMAQEEQEKNISDTIVHKIQRNTRLERSKMLVRWERDNGYIDKEGEKFFEITPLVRKKLLAEIEAEEEKTESYWWKIGKAGGKGILFGVSFVIAGMKIYSGNDIKKSTVMQAIIGAATQATIITSAIVTAVEVIEAQRAWSWKQLWKKSKQDKEIKLPPLRNLPTIPKNHTRVDVYSYGL